MSSRVFPSIGEKPKFDPNAAYEVVQESPVPKGAKPKFDPNKQFHAVAEEQQTQPAQQPKQEQPAFKPMTDWLAIPMASDKTIDKHNTETVQAQERIKTHLGDIDNSVRNLLYEHKKDLTGRVKSQELAINPSEQGPINFQAQQLAQKDKRDVYVSPVEVESFKSEIPNNPVLLRRSLDQKAKDLSKTNPGDAATLKADIYRVDRQNNPERENKIAKNVEGIKNGELDYDIVNGQLVKPEGFLGSLATGYKEKVQAFDDYGVYQTGDKKAILDLINKRLKYDPDEAAPQPKGEWVQGFFNEMARMAGGQPLKPLIGGAAASIAGPEAGVAAASAITAPEMYKLTFGATLPQNYAAIKKAHPDWTEEQQLQEAIDFTHNQANIDALSGAAMGVLGAKAGLKPTGLNSGLLQKSLGNALKQVGQETVKKTLEGLGVGAIGASGQLVKNLMAQQEGIPIDESEGLIEQLIAGLKMTAGMHMIAKFPELLKPKTYNQLLQSFKNVPKEQVESELNNLQQSGQITEEQAKNAQTAIKQHADIDNSIKPNVPESDRLKVQEKIKKRNELEASLETTDKAYHPDIKEQIKVLNEEIVNLSNGKERGELQQLVDKESKDENIKGFTAEALKDASENDLKKYFKEISEQAYDPNSEATTLATFGENIVNKAKELYPQEQPKESSISVIQPGEIKHPEIITIKPKEDAIQVGGPEAAIVDETSGGRPKMESGIPEPKEATIPQKEGVPTEEGKATGQEGIGAAREVGITHRQMDMISEELGLPKYEGSPEKQSEWSEQAAKKLATDPNALSNLFDKLRNGIAPDAVETKMMLQYMGDLMAKLDKDPYSRPLQNQLLRTKDLFNIAGRIQGKGLAARKGSIPAEETLSDFIIRDRETNKAPLTDEQITVSKKEYEDIKAAKDAFEAKLAAEKEKQVKQKAEKIVAEEAKKAKKQTGKDFTTERKQIIDDIAKKWKDSRGQISATFIPYADRLIKIAPDVVKLMKSYVEQGISELPELVKAIHATIKDHIDGLTEKDVHDIIAGEYNQKKPTRNQLAQQVYDLRKEASLINELDQLQNGEIPKSEKKQRQRNQRIEDLRGQIKELRDEMGLNEKTDADKLASLKSRYKKQISDIENKIAASDYGPDVKSEPIKLDKEAIELKDKMIKLKLDREARLVKQEYENRTGIQKAKDLGADALDAVRTIQTNPDLSFFGRQGIKYLVTHPVKGPKLFWESVKQAGSQKRYDRWLFDVHNSAAWKLIEDSGLAVLDPSTLHASKREEQWRSQLIHKIPVAGQIAKASERAFTSAANMARVDWFMEGVDILSKQGKTWENSPEEYKGWASAVNNMTGRGGLGAFEPIVGQLAIPFWSPRLIASNVNLFLNPKYYVKMPKTARIMLIKNMAQYVASGIGFMVLANTLGAETEVDPRSSDFGKIKVGNTRYDIWGGASQYIRVLSQIFSNRRKTGDQISKIGARGQVITGANLIRTKLSPIWGFGVSAVIGEDVVGEKVEWKDAYKLMIPMLYNDIKEAANDKKGGPETAAVAGLLSFLGIGASTYGDKSTPQSTTQSRERPTRTKPTRTNPHKR